MGRVTSARWRQLDFEEIMELVSGRLGDSVFASEQDRAAAWRDHGEDLMESGAYRAGDRAWGYWRYEVGVDEPATRLERVLLLEERGLLTEEERQRIVSEAEHARKRWRGHCVTTPREAAESMERKTRAREDEAIEIAAAIKERARDRAA